MKQRKVNVIKEDIILGGNKVWRLDLKQDDKNEDLFVGNIQRIIDEQRVINRRVTWNVASYAQCAITLLKEARTKESFNALKKDAIVISKELLEASELNGFVLFEKYCKYWGNKESEAAIEVINETEMQIKTVQASIAVSAAASKYGKEGGYKTGVETVNAAVAEIELLRKQVAILKKEIKELTDPDNNPDPDKKPVPKAESNDSASPLSEQCRIYMQCSNTNSVEKAFDEALTHLEEVETSAENEVAHFMRIEEENEELLQRIEEIESNPVTKIEREEVKPLELGFNMDELITKLTPMIVAQITPEITANVLKSIKETTKVIDNTIPVASIVTKKVDKPTTSAIDFKEKQKAFKGSNDGCDVIEDLSAATTKHITVASDVIDKTIEPLRLAEEERARKKALRAANRA